MQSAVHIRLFGFPVRATGAFWIVLVFVALRSDDLRISALTFVLVTLSIVVHELGHAFAFRRYGARATIALHGIGGITSTIAGAELTRREHIWVSLAGPAASIVVLGVPSGVLWDALQPSGLPGRVLFVMFVLNVGWALMNLVPVLPLDGGHIAENVAALLTGRDQHVATRRFSVIAAAIAGLSFASGWTWLAILFSALAAFNVFAVATNASSAGSIPIRRSSRRHRPARGKHHLLVSREKVVAAAFAALRADEPGLARQLLASVELPRGESLHALAVEIEFWSWLREGDPVRARTVFEAAADGLSDGAKAAMLADAGEDEAAVAVYAEFLMAKAGPKTRQEAVHQAALTGHLTQTVCRILDTGESDAFAEVMKIESVLGRIGLEQERATVSSLLIG